MRGSGPDRVRPRLLLAVTLSEWGGAQAYVHALARAARDAYEVTVLTAPGGRLVEVLRKEAIRVLTVPTLQRAPHPVRDALALAHIVSVLRRERFDLIHANSTKAGILVRAAARLTGTSPIIFTAHGWAFGGAKVALTRWLIAHAERVAAGWTTRIICVSAHDRELALRCRVAAPDQLSVIPMGVDPAPFLADRPLARATGPGDEPVIIAVGRLARPKDPVVLVEAVSRLKVGRVLIVGDGPLRRGVEEAIRRRRLNGRVRLLGFRDDVPDLLRASDVFVLSSWWEGMPLAIIEAMLAGLPVVATAVGGIPELVEHGVTGLLIRVGDAGGLAQALARLVADDPLRRRMGEAGRRRALQSFNLQDTVAHTLALYETLRSPRDDATVCSE